MHAIACEVPSSSALSQDLVRSAYFHDSWRVPLARPEISIDDEIDSEIELE